MTDERTTIRKSASTLRAELLEAQRALMATRQELLKAQIVAATRLDVIRLLGCAACDRKLDSMQVLAPEQAQSVQLELRELAVHLRKRAAEIDALVNDG